MAGLVFLCFLAALYVLYRLTPWASKPWRTAVVRNAAVNTNYYGYGRNKPQYNNTVAVILVKRFRPSSTQNS